MKKRGQTTVFIILAIVIVGVIAGGTYIYTQNREEASRQYFSQASIKPTFDSIINGVQTCEEQTANDALETIGVQGGYYNKPNEVFDLGDVFVPYYYKEGQLLAPDKVVIEKELSAYVDAKLTNCLNEINYPDFKISYNIPRTITNIKEKEVTFNTNLPIIIGREKYRLTVQLKDYPVAINSELNAIIDLANYITDFHEEDPSLYCITCINELAETSNLYVDVLESGDNEVIVIISENHTSPEPYSFEFMNKYTGNEESPVLEPESNPPSPQ